MFTFSLSDSFCTNFAYPGSVQLWTLVHGPSLLGPQRGFLVGERVNLEPL